MAELKRLDNGNIELRFTIAWTNIEAQYEKVVEEAVTNTEMEGFRKGKAPRNLVEPKLDKTKLYAKAIEQLLPEVYSLALKEHSLNPVLSPHVHLEKGEEGQDWQFVATTCETPQVTLPDLGPLKEQKELADKVEWLHKSSTVKVPDLLVEEEANHRLSALAENVTKLGLTTEQYLASKKIDIEGLKAQTASQSKADLEVEFILEEIRKANSFKTRKETLDYLQGLV